MEEDEVEEMDVVEEEMAGGRGRGPPGAARGRGGGGADAPDFSSGKLFFHFVFYMN